MKKRRKKRRKQDEEQALIKPPSREKRQDEGEKVAVREKRPFSPQHLASMQRQYGNTYVQRMIAEEQTSLQDELDNATEHSFDAPTKLRPGGVLEVDLKPALELRHFNITDPEWEARIKRWVGIGGVQLDDAKTPTTDIKVQTDGKLELQLGSTLPNRLQRMAQAVGQPIDLKRPFGEAGLSAEATLHVERKPLEKLPLDKIVPFLNEHKQQESLFLHIHLQSEFPIGEDGTETALFDTNLLLVAEG
ncbi:MAG: hypothetical protein AAF490_00535 [Chloroflexota bacterium]